MMCSKVLFFMGEPLSVGCFELFEETGVVL